MYIEPIPELRVAGSHHEVGAAIGKRFARQIRGVLADYSSFHDTILPFFSTAEGQAFFHSLLEVNRAIYPGYMDELIGTADGAGVPSAHLFLLNIRGEVHGYLRDRVGGCTDCAVLRDDQALIGHNEDNVASIKSHTYVVHAKVNGRPAFTAFTYPGELCGNAFGFNSQGVCFSVDGVSPIEVATGLGRNMVARSLLDAGSLEDAIKRASIQRQAIGLSYTIGSVAQRRIAVVEVAPGSHHVEMVHGVYCHTNHYLHLLDLNQAIGPSSIARLQRATELLGDRTPLDAADILDMLGDMANPAQPIYRATTIPDKVATFCTALFDLDARRLRVYLGHPIEAGDQFMTYDL